MLDRHERRTEGLRSWAAGILAQEAAVELLIAFGHGRLLDDPWVRPGGFGSHWFDTARAASEGGHLSGGEKRVLAIAASLISAEHPVDLGDAITGLDPDALGLVLDALARAGGQTAGPKITSADDEKET